MPQPKNLPEVLMKKNNKIWIYGASGHGKVIYDCLMACGHENIGFVDDDPKKVEINGLMIHKTDSINPDDEQIIIGVGDSHIRRRLVESHLFKYHTVMHPTATLSPFSSVGEGSVLFHHCIIQSGTIIGRHCIVNTAASIDHDCEIGDYVHISPNATLCGGVTIGEGTHIGAGAIVIPGVKIGKWAVIGAGAVVTSDIPDKVVVVGIPARVSKHIPD